MCVHRKSNPAVCNMGIRLYERMVILKHQMNRMYVSLQNVVQLYLSRGRKNNWNEGEKRDMNEYLEEEVKIWIMDHPVAAKKMLGEEDQAEGGESDDQGDDGEDRFGESGHENKDVSSCNDDRDNGSRHGQEMLGLKLPVYKSPIENFG